MTGSPLQFLSAGSPKPFHVPGRDHGRKFGGPYVVPPVGRNCRCLDILLQGELLATPGTQRHGTAARELTGKGRSYYGQDRPLRLPLKGPARKRH